MMTPTLAFEVTVHTPRIRHSDQLVRADSLAGFRYYRMREPPPRVLLFLTTQQFSLRVPDLQAMAVDHVVIWPQRFGGFDRQFE
jgi:hypothetical protein